jgi:hypothetical protein
MDKQPELTITTMSVLTFKNIASKISFEENGCWIWTGAKMVDGYGCIRYKGKTQLMHRLLYAWLIKPIPVGHNPQYQLDHLCNNRLCCNPQHLQITTQRVNVLRGNGPTAINARKTHCIHGHLLPKKTNRSDGGRRCKICRRQADKEYWKKRRKNYIRHKPSNPLP